MCSVWQAETLAMAPIPEINIMSEKVWAKAIQAAGLQDIHQRVIRAERLSFEDGMRLYATPQLNLVGYLANIVRERKNGNVAYWVRNQHVNYTNVCNKGCLFCSFYAKPKDDAARLCDDARTGGAKVSNYRDVPITEIHVVGGVNPKLPYDYYLDFCAPLKPRVPRRISKRSPWWKWTKLYAPPSESDAP